MDRAKDLERFFEEIMSADAANIETPDVSQFYEARAKVAARKKVVKEESSWLDKLILFFRLDFKFYHVGLSVLLIFAGIFWLNEPNYSADHASGLIEYHEALSASNTTISVNSSTMLTSIPTTVIRN